MYIYSEVYIYTPEYIYIDYSTQQLVRNSVATALSLENLAAENFRIDYRL